MSPYDKEHIDKIIMHNHGDWFTARLLRLLQHADARNLARLQTVYPKEVAAFLQWRDKNNTERALA